MRRTLLLVAALWIGAQPLARADGIILPPVAAPEVTMPDQRALLVWRDGVETLVIESRFAGEGESFAWVVPLPSKPEVRPATAGTLPSLAASFQPRIIPPASAWILTGVLILGFPLLLLFAFEPHRAKVIYSRTIAMLLGVAAVAGGWGLIENLTHGYGNGLLAIPVVILAAISWTLWRKPLRIVTAWILVLLILLLVTMGIPAFAKVRSLSERTPSGLVVERQIVGDYVVFTLSGQEAGQITNWLTQNGFAIPSASASVFAEHVQSGGCFVAVKLNRPASTGQTQVPHPLVFTFKTPEAIYPMKLTGTGIHDSLDLDLFVFGDATASLDSLPLRACGSVEFASPAVASGHSAREQSAVDRIHISHSSLRELCAGTTVGTRLRGKLTPEQMREDFRIEWRPFTGPRGLACFTKSDAWGYGALIGVGTLLISGSALFWFHRPQRPSSRARVALLAIAVTIGAASTFAFPTAPTRAGPSRYRHHIGLRTLQHCLHAATTSAADCSEAELRQRIHAVFTDLDSDTSAALRSLPAYGDGPDNYHLQKGTDGQWHIVLIDWAGQEHVAKD